MILILILGEKKKTLIQSLLFFLLIILHKHTALYTGDILAINTALLWFQKKRFPLKESMYFIIAGLTALAVYIPFWSRIMPEAVKAVSSTFG